MLIGKIINYLLQLIATFLSDINAEKLDVDAELMNRIVTRLYIRISITTRQFEFIYITFLFNKLLIC